MKSEHCENWEGGYEEISEAKTTDDCNILSSHAIFIIKIQDNGTLKLKGRILVHGNRDNEREII